MKGFPIQEIESLTHLVTHANCSDGLASAMIFRVVKPSIKVTFVNYKSKELAELQPEPGMVFCDFCPPFDRLREFVNVGAYCLDHHKEAKDDILAFGERGIFADENLQPGVSGAVLAYDHIFEPWFKGATGNTLVQDFATKVGVRDTWVRNSPLWEASQEQHQLLSFFPYQAWLGEEGSIPIIPPSVPNITIGQVLHERSLKSVKSAIAKAQFIEVLGRKFCIMASLATSDVAEELDGQVDAVFGFAYDVGPEGKIQMRISLRSHSDLNVGALAKKRFGGGGHTRASGLEIQVSPEDLNPYSVIGKIIQEWGASGFEV